jgi:hypothetical protein
MRAIKVRWWDKFDKRMIEWQDLTKDEMSERVLLDVILNPERYVPLQFICLVDKNGKKNL